MGVIFSFVIALLVAALVIWIVSKFNLGLSVTGFAAAIIAALVIAVVGAAINWLLSLFGISLGTSSFLAWLVYIVVAAVVLMISDRFVPGLKVAGFTGALIAAISIGVVGWLISWVFGLFGIAV